MSSENIIGIVELGNINIKCLIFKTDNNKSEILSKAITPSDGFHNDVVVNLAKASNAVRVCISRAEKKANISLKKVSVLFEQPEFLCTKFSKNIKIDGSQIQKDDIEFLLKEGKRQLILNDRKQSLIHIFNYNYTVDGKDFHEEPIGVYTDSLSHEITFITAPKNNLKNINKVFNDCDIEIERLISQTFALGVKILNNKELEFGSTVINLESEKTSIGLFKNFALIHSATFPIGINHIIKDIAQVCSLNLDESQAVVNDIDFTFVNNKKLFDQNDYLNNSYFIKSRFRKISKSLIYNVIKARLDEICDKLQNQLIVPGFNHTSGISFLLAGHGSDLLNIDIFFVNILGPNVKKMDKNNFENEVGLEKNLATCFGAFKIIKEGWETEAIPKKNIKSIEKISFFERFFKIH